MYFSSIVSSVFWLIHQFTKFVLYQNRQTFLILGKRGKTWPYSFLEMSSVCLFSRPDFLYFLKCIQVWLVHNVIYQIYNLSLENRCIKKPTFPRINYWYYDDTWLQQGLSGWIPVHHLALPLRFVRSREGVGVSRFMLRQRGRGEC